MNSIKDVKLLEKLKDKYEDLTHVFDERTI